MEKEILEQYNKVKDILSEEEFLNEIEQIRPNYEDLPFMDEVDIAKEVVKKQKKLLRIILVQLIFQNLKILLMMQILHLKKL